MRAVAQGKGSAKALHFDGPRSKRPFVAVHLAAVPQTLFESELLDHERGAFAGATTQRPECFEQAHGDTQLLNKSATGPLPCRPSCRGHSRKARSAAVWAARQRTGRRRGVPSRGPAAPHAAGGHSPAGRESSEDARPR